MFLFPGGFLIYGWTDASSPPDKSDWRSYNMCLSFFFEITPCLFVLYYCIFSYIHVLIYWKYFEQNININYRRS